MLTKSLLQETNRNIEKIIYNFLKDIFAKVIIKFMTSNLFSSLIHL